MWCGSVKRQMTGPCQAAELLSRRDDIIATFNNEHRILLQLTEQFESTAAEMQQKRVIAGT